MRSLAALALALAAPAAAALLPQDPCQVYGAASAACAARLLQANASLAGQPPLTLERATDLCLLRCAVCTRPEYMPWQVGLPSAGSLCDDAAPSAAAYLPDAIVAGAAAAVFNASAALSGQYFLDYPGGPEENASLALPLQLARMPRRDLLLLLTEPALFVDFLLENLRYALHTRAWSVGWGVTWDLFVDAVLPYAVIDEKRDLWWRPRARLAALLRNATAGAPNATAAMRAVAAALPHAASQGVLALASGGGAAVEALAPGPPFTWRSSTSPAYLSVQQVAAFGGSCTGTGVVLVAAARAVGVPARLAGCGQTDVAGDDHHWAEFWDGSAAGPLGPGGWHTKEGTSAGNEGGPWDAPSGPMLGCLAGVAPFSALNSLWAASPASPVYLPLLWSNDSFSQAWGFVGGLDRCGAYCSAWGCGPGNAQRYSQAQCSQYPD
jgi:hypothetical protein